MAPHCVTPRRWGWEESPVVQFVASTGDRWTANFRSGIAGLSEAFPHPNDHDVLVFSGGDLWVVDPDSSKTSQVASAIDSCWPLADGLVLSRQGLAFLKLGTTGVVWHTKRLSWDVFGQVVVTGHKLTALAWSPLSDSWESCSVDLTTGASSGGSFSDDDSEGWERLAPAG